jgi:hypothetical protein
MVKYWSLFILWLAEIVLYVVHLLPRSIVVMYNQWFSLKTGVLGYVNQRGFISLLVVVQIAVWRRWVYIVCLRLAPLIPCSYGVHCLTIFVIYDIGSVMIMEVMVGILLVFTYHHVCVHCGNPFSWVLLMNASCYFHLQVCCFYRESTQTVVHNQDLGGHTLRVMNSLW